MMHYVANKKLVWREIESKIYIIDGEREKMHSLNTTASFIWKMILKGKKIEEIEKELLNEFDADKANIKKDIKELISRFLKENLIYEEKEKI